MSKKKSHTEDTSSGGIGGILGGLADLVEKLSDLAEKGEEMSKSGEFQSGGEKGIKGVYGFSVKMGLGRDGGIKVEPFGNIHRDAKSGEATVEENREPVIDVFEEEDHTLIVAEMPGISVGDVKLEVEDDLLTIHAEHGDKKYYKEVLLSQNYSREKIDISCNNGIIEIKCRN